MASPPPRPSVARSFLRFLAENKAWWLTPIVLVLGLLVAVVVFGALGGWLPAMYRTH
jgi:hypothetical protein